jgi:hypothetical protein
MTWQAECLPHPLRVPPLFLTLGVHGDHFTFAAQVAVGFFKVEAAKENTGFPLIRGFDKGMNG